MYVVNDVKLLDSLADTMNGKDQVGEVVHVNRLMGDLFDVQRSADQRDASLVF